LFQDSRDSDTVKRISLRDNPPLFVIAILEHESGVNHRASFKMLQYIIVNGYNTIVGKKHLIEDIDLNVKITRQLHLLRNCILTYFLVVMIIFY